MGSRTPCPNSRQSLWGCAGHDIQQNEVGSPSVWAASELQNFVLPKYFSYTNLMSPPSFGLSVKYICALSRVLTLKVCKEV